MPDDGPAPTDGSDPALAAFLEAWGELTGEGGPFATVATEVRGIPMRTYASAFPSLRTLWELTAGYADRTYLVYEDERLTYGEVHAQVRSLAQHLRDVHGVGSGDRVALAMRNLPEWVVGHWATVCLGASVVGVNAWWTTDELRFGLADSRPKVLIVDDERLERVLPVLDELRAEAPLAVIATRTDRDLPTDAVRWDDVVRVGGASGAVSAPAALPEADIDPDDDALVFYTSGTTGFPKGAQLTHRGSVHNVLDLVFWTSVTSLVEAKLTASNPEPPAEVDGSDSAPPEPPAGPDAGQLVFMGPTPLFHVTACNCLLHPATLAGGRIVLLRKWDAGRALELIEREGVTNFSGVPTMARELLAHPDFATRDTSTVASIAGGGAPVPPDLVDKIERSSAKTSPSTGYGLTETSGIITANSARTYLAKPGSCGPVVPVLDAKLVDEAGADLSAGPDAVGELCVRGPVVAKGYLNRPDATAEAFPEGWFHTGDIARIDADGFVWIVDRAKDLVIRGGENISCPEVEAAIYQHPEVAEVAVFGLPDERLGESLAAVVVPVEGASLDEAAVQAWVGERLAAFKVPATVVVRTESLPRNATGKFLKRSLRDDLVAGA